MIAAALLLALQSASPPDEAQLAEMHRAYEQSCVQRDYGAFDDICNQLADQIAAYERRASARPPRQNAPPRPLPPAASAPPASLPPAQGTDATAGR